jgi:hypothetical protein
MSFFDSFGRKAPPAPAKPGPDVEADDQRARIEAQVRAAVAKDPAFQVLTVDGLWWICPYTSELISAGFGMPEAAVESLLERQPWTQAKPRPALAVHCQRWRIHLDERMTEDPRLRFIENDLWLNPVDGRWVRIPGLEAGTTIADERLDQMALALAQAAGPSGGVIKSHAELKGIFHQRKPSGLLRVKQRTPRAGTRIPSAAAEPGPAKQVRGLPTVRGYELALAYEPQGEGTDAYEAGLFADGRLALLLISAGSGSVALAALQAARSFVRECRDPSQLIARIDATMRTAGADRRLALWVCALDPRRHRLEAAGAGLPPALLICTAPDAAVRQLGTSGPVIEPGGSPIRDRVARVDIELRPGDLIVAATSGLTATTDVQDRPFAWHRLAGTLLAAHDEGVAAALAKAVEASRVHGLGVFASDVAAIALARTT